MQVDFQADKTQIPEDWRKAGLSPSSFLLLAPYAPHSGPQSGWPTPSSSQHPTHTYYTCLLQHKTEAGVRPYRWVAVLLGAPRPHSPHTWALFLEKEVILACPLSLGTGALPLNPRNTPSDRSSMRGHHNPSCSHTLEVQRWHSPQAREARDTQASSSTSVLGS